MHRKVASSRETEESVIELPVTWSQREARSYHLREAEHHQIEGASLTSPSFDVVGKVHLRNTIINQWFSFWARQDRLCISVNSLLIIAPSYQCHYLYIVPTALSSSSLIFFMPCPIIKDDLAGFSKKLLGRRTLLFL